MLLFLLFLLEEKRSGVVDDCLLHYMSHLKGFSLFMQTYMYNVSFTFTLFDPSNVSSVANQVEYSNVLPKHSEGATLFFTLPLT